MTRLQERRDQIAYDMLVAAAEVGAQCPTNAELKAAGSGHINTTLRSLQRRRLITRAIGGNYRCITIVATGKSTEAIPHHIVCDTKRPVDPDTDIEPPPLLCPDNFPFVDFSGTNARLKAPAQRRHYDGSIWPAGVV